MRAAAALYFTMVYVVVFWVGAGVLELLRWGMRGGVWRGGLRWAENLIGFLRRANLPAGFRFPKQGGAGGASDIKTSGSSAACSLHACSNNGGHRHSNESACYARERL